MTKKWADWVERSTAPTGHEIGRLVQPVEPELLEAASQATRPLEAEVNRLLMSRARVQVPAGPGWLDWLDVRPQQLVLAGVAAAAVSAVGVYSFMPQAYGIVGSPLGEVAQWHGSFELGPSIDVDASGTLRVAQADRSGTVVDLIDGTATFSVEPDGVYRHLVVRAQDVEVEVKGTVFDVSVDDGTVWVGCSRGQVEVRYAGTEFGLPAGNRWNTTELAVQMVEAGAPSHTQGRVASAVVPVPSSAEPLPDAVIRTVPGEPAGVAETDAASQDHPGAQAVSEDEGTDTDARSRPRTSGGDFAKAKNRMRSGADSAEMLGIWEAFLADWPDSPEADQARVNRLKAKATMQPSSMATLREIDAFIEASDGSRRKDVDREAHLLRSAVARDGIGDCSLALDSYYWLVANTDTRIGAMASAWLGLCDASLQDEDALMHLQRAMDMGISDAELRAEVATRAAEIESRLQPRRRGR